MGSYQPMDLLFGRIDRQDDPGIAEYLRKVSGSTGPSKQIDGVVYYHYPIGPAPGKERLDVIPQADTFYYHRRALGSVGDLTLRLPDGVVPRVKENRLFVPGDPGGRLALSCRGNFQPVGAKPGVYGVQEVLAPIGDNPAVVLDYMCHSAPPGR